MKVEIKELNKSLKNFDSIRYKTPVFRNAVKEVGPDTYEDEYNEIYEVYDIGLPEGLFIKLHISSDSYGNNEYIKRVEFVKAQEKIVKVYEYIE